MNGILKKIILAVVAIPLVAEGLQWAAFRSPKNPPMVLTLRHNLPGYKPEVNFTLDKELSLRGMNWTAGEKPTGALRILCVGGEATFAQFQEAGDAWWGEMQKKLEQKYPGRRIEVAANASPTNGSLRAAKWLSEVAPLVKPDIILCNLGAQDIFMQPLEYKKRVNKLATLSSTLPTRTGLRATMLEISQTARRMRASNVKREGKIISAGFEDRDMNKLFSSKRADYAKLRPRGSEFRLSDNDPRDEYLEALNSILDTSQSVGAQLVATGEPMLPYREMELMDEKATAQLGMLIVRTEGGSEGYRMPTGWLFSELRRYQEAAQTWATDKKVTFLDLNGKVTRDAEHFTNELMLTDKGAELMAEQVLPAVEPILAPLAK